FNNAYINGFLNSSQTGIAHLHVGITLSSLISQLWISAIVCLAQFFLFISLRSRLKNVYEPRCHYFIPFKMTPIEPGLKAWYDAMFHDCHLTDYLALGLDAYFFMRYLGVLMLIFITLALSIIPVLIPLNWCSGSDIPSSYTRGLDKLAWSNISPQNVYRLKVHLVCAIVVIVSIQALISFELNNFIKIRHSHLSRDYYQQSTRAVTILLDNVSNSFQNEEALLKIFDVLPGGVKQIWLLKPFGKIELVVGKIESSIKKLENRELAVIKAGISKNRVKVRRGQTPKLTMWGRYFTRWLTYVVEINPFQQPKSSEESIAELNYLLEQLEDLKLEASDTEILPYNKVFIQFNSPIGACIASQCLLTLRPGEMNSIIPDICPEDIIWTNIQRNKSVWTSNLKACFSNILSISVIVGWVVPVSFISMLSQIPYLTSLLPFLSFLNYFPKITRNVLAELLPTVAMAVLLEGIFSVMRTISKFRGNLTGASVELDVQGWLFAFLFVNLFLVVTISSSITVILQHLINNPVSISTLLAANFPKATNFFFSYFVLRGMSYFGVNLLRINKLLPLLLVYPFTDTTPRQAYTRKTKLQQVKWGSIYPTCSVYACIGITYCIISPLISIFALSIFFFYYIYFKWSLKYVYDYRNPSETNGRLYPTALRQLYTGIYCLELCLLGLFLLAKDENGNSVCQFHAGIMILLFVGTVLTNIRMNSMYRDLLTQTLLSLLSKDTCNSHTPGLESTGEHSESSKKTFLHKSSQFQMPVIWLPKDPYGFSEKGIKEL
ncbi:hypothetical protein BABINDRAFT_18083, partial [Babjeviella inositovora NRRL Y-12698]